MGYSEWRDGRRSVCAALGFSLSKGERNDQRRSTVRSPGARRLHLPSAKLTALAASVSPRQWAESLSAPPIICSSAAGWTGALLRRWRGTAPDMEQPRLDSHYVVLHLDGAKRVSRRGGGGGSVIAEARPGAITFVPVGLGCSWKTEGPIGFAHLYLDPRQVARVVQEEFDRDPSSVDMIDCVGRELPLLAALFLAMLDEVRAPTFASRLTLDTLLHTLIVRLLCQCSTLAVGGAAATYKLAPRRLQRVLEYMDANLGREIELDDLAGAAGSSRYHFSRAFREATGYPPYRYLIRRRIDAAKTLLLQDTLSIADVAQQCGFNSKSQFSAMFRRVFGTSPGRFRREH